MAFRDWFCLSLALMFSLPPGTLWNVAGITAVISLFMLNGITHLLDAQISALVFAIIPTMFLPAVILHATEKLQPGHTLRFMPRHFFYLAYAGHLLVLGLFRYLS
jgi:hypothetical protein